MPLKDEKETTDGSSNKSSNEESKQQREADEAAIQITNKKESRTSEDVRKKRKEKLLRLRQQRIDEAAMRRSSIDENDSRLRQIGRRQGCTDEAAVRTTNSDKIEAPGMNFEEDGDFEDYSTDDAEGNGNGVTRHHRPTSSSTYSAQDNDTTTNNDVDMNGIELCSSSSSSPLQSSYNNPDSQLQSSYNNNSQLRLSFNSDSELPKASPVDMDALRTQYQAASRGSILQRMKAEITVADEVVENNNNERSISNFRIMVSTVAFIIIAIAIGVVVTFTKKQDGKDKIMFEPTTSPTLSNFINLQEQMKSISGDTVFDDSSPQYKALLWLTYEDSFILDIQTQRDVDDELSDRYIVAVVYFSTGGPNWVNDLNFLTNSSICDWNNHYNEKEEGVIFHRNRFSNGVHCDNRGVTKILLDRNNLNGTIPFEIGSTLKYVDEISVSNNNLYGTIPSSFGNLFRLELLEASSNVLSGPIPSSFSRLTRLEYFSTRSNHLTGPIPSGITNLISLERLDLSVNKLTGSIPEFSLQNSLEYLSIFENLLDGPLPESLVELSHLEVINLSDNLLTGILSSRLGMLENLSYLVLSHNEIGGSLPTSIGNLHLVTTLALDSNSLNGSIPSEIGKLTNLQHLYLDRNNLSGTIPTELGQCTKMIWLFLENNPEIIGTLPHTFSNMYQLGVLFVHGTGFAGSIDTNVCNLMGHVTADCGGLSPKVNCTCCDTCCDPISGICTEDIDKTCDTIEYHATFAGYTSECTCEGSLVKSEYGFTCKNDGGCPTCNEDNTICGAIITWGHKLLTPLLRTFHNLFQYNVGRNESIMWSETPEFDCNVSINGQQCNECSVYYCRDGFPGRYIDCTNIVDVVDGGVYDTCQHYEKGGVLEYFSWFDTASWTGCLPFYYRPLQ